MLSELDSLHLKLCSKQYNKIDLLHMILGGTTAKVAGNITTQPKQGRQAALMSNLYVFSYVYELA